MKNKLENSKLDYLFSIYSYWSHSDRTKEDIFFNFKEVFEYTLPYSDQIQAIEFFICEGLEDESRRDTPERKTLWTATRKLSAERTEADYKVILAAIIAETKAMIEAEPPKVILDEYRSLFSIPKESRTETQTTRLGELATYIYEYKK